MLNRAKVIAFAPAKDLQAARKFYAGVLGLRFVSEDPFAAVFEAGGTMLRVSKVEDFEPPPFTILGWRVPKIEPVVRKLTTRGVSFNRYSFLQQDELGIWVAPSAAKVAWFKDPDGNVLSLTEFPSKSSRTTRKRNAASARRGRR
jgi:catechol 2,3-dioxygenase-like lactoylglutathione lyase family enzyme